MADDAAVVELVRDELERITDTGELASRAVLRERVGLGAGDLQRALDVLRDRGEASEVEPDGYRLVRDEHDLVPGPGQPVVEPGVSLAEAERGLPPAGTQARARMTAHRQEVGEKRVTLTTAVAKAIGPEGLGNLVAAGIAEADEAGVSFVFEVAP